MGENNFNECARSSKINLGDALMQMSKSGGETRLSTAPAAATDFGEKYEQGKVRPINSARLLIKVKSLRETCFAHD
jgi:hypothetical protein